MQRLKSTVNLPECKRGVVREWPDNARTAVLVATGVLQPEHPPVPAPPGEIPNDGLWDGDTPLVIDATNEADVVPPASSADETPDAPPDPDVPTDVNSEPVVDPQL